MTVHWSLWLVAGGVAMAVVTIALLVRHRRFLARATHTSGTVSELVGDGSGEFPVVEFSSTTGKVAFRSRVGGAYRVGQAVPVAYDPSNPARAVIDSHGWIWLYRMTIAIGVSIAIMGVVFNLAFPRLERAVAARDVAIDRFLALVRAGDLAAARASAARDYKLDEAYLRAHVPSSRAFESQSSATDSDSACVAGALLPSRTRLVLDLVVESGQWKVRRAGLKDPCEDDRLD